MTSASWPNSPFDLLLSTSKLVCGGHSGALWLLSHHPGGCCTLVVDEEIPPDNVEYFECLEKKQKYKCNELLLLLLLLLSLSDRLRLNGSSYFSGAFVVYLTPSRCDRHG